MRSMNTSRYFRDVDPVATNFTLDEIETILRSGNLEGIRELSRYYYRTNNVYRNNIDFLAALPLYDTMVTPVYQEDNISKAQTIKAFYAACNFVDKLNVPVTFQRITKEWLKNGVFYGILRTDGEEVVIQDLPLEWCRTRYKEFNGLNLLEFNVNYFNSISDEEYRKEVVQTFPKVIQEAWRQIVNRVDNADPWVPIPAGEGGVCFCFVDDPTPPLLASLKELKELDDATKREEKRDINELYKLLIQRMPIDKNGELVFELEEVADIHASVANMLSDVDTVDVLTTFGETSLESLQDSSAATQSTDRLKKYKDSAWDALGRARLLFNPEGSSALAYMIKKDESLMITYLNVYEGWIKFHLNDRFARRGLTFDFDIIPTTVFNRQDLQSQYFRGAQYGYSKMAAGVAMGIKQMDQLSLMNFENDLLEMSKKMVPLQSSYTTSGNVIVNEEKNNSSGENGGSSVQIKDITDRGGRPELPDEQKSEKTQANIAAEG